MRNLGMITLAQQIAVEKHVGIFFYVYIGGLVVTGSLS